MTYVALLRGINVGGNNMMEMKRLKATFEAAGMTHVRTYINSGNVVFRAHSADRAGVERLLEAAIERDFELRIKVLLRDGGTVLAIAAALPDNWTNDAVTRCDVMYLWEDVDRPGILGELPAKPGIDEVRYVPGALLWHVARENVRRSGMVRIVGTPLYAKMTVRNCNTARKLAQLVRETDAAE